jgi:type IV pilus assembly protein PilN
VRQSEERIEIEGAAQSSTRVSALMRNIDNSEWLRKPGLDVVRTVEAGPAKSAQFTLFAEQVPMVEDTTADVAEGATQ